MDTSLDIMRIIRDIHEVTQEIHALEYDLNVIICNEGFHSSVLIEKQETLSLLIALKIELQSKLLITRGF